MTAQARVMTADVIGSWWKSLQPVPETGKLGDRATLARLRRCNTVMEALFEPSVVALARRCGAKGEGGFLARIALAAAVLSHVRNDRPEAGVARQVGPSEFVDLQKASETALCSPIRFRRLLEAETCDECLRAFRRLVRLAGNEVNVRDLAEALLAWPREEGRGEQAERIRRRWVYDYWNAGEPNAPAMPDHDDSETERKP